MSDWDEVAERYTTAKADAEAAVLRRRKNADDERARTATAADQARDALKAAIVDATRNLREYLAEHGAAAKRLIAAAPSNQIRFGGESEGGYGSCVYLGAEGLTFAAGPDSWGAALSGKQPPVSTRPCDEEKAVEYFAYYGEGALDPRKVRRIACWLAKRLDETAEAMSDQAERLAQEATQP